jgi:hypothetical protein
MHRGLNTSRFVYYIMHATLHLLSYCINIRDLGTCLIAMFQNCIPSVRTHALVLVLKSTL